MDNQLSQQEIGGTNLSGAYQQLYHIIGELLHSPDAEQAISKLLQYALALMHEQAAASGAVAVEAQ